MSDPDPKVFKTFRVFIPQETGRFLAVGLIVLIPNKHYLGRQSYEYKQIQEAGSKYSDC